MDASQSRLYEFGDFRLDSGRRELSTRSGVNLSLTPKAYETLLYLVEHPGVVVEKERLMREIWPDTVVEENNLNQAISTVRRVLGERPGQNRYVVTVPGRGYRFAAEVTDPSNTPPHSRPAAASRRWTVVGPAVAAALLVVVAIPVLIQWKGARNPTDADRAARNSMTELRSVAVLPFKPLVADQRDESLEMGMADTLIVQLSTLGRIRVPPITAVRRFGGIEQDAVAAGRKLRVESVVDGSIQRADDRIRVTARLLRVSDGAQLWAGAYDETLTGVFDVQDAISEKILAALALELTGQEHRRLTQRYTDDAAAYQLYLSGRFHWQKRTEEDLRTAIHYFSQAIEKDPRYALAHVGLADAYAILGVLHVPPNEAFPKSREAALNAIGIDDRLGEAHTSLGHVKVQYEYDWVGAEREYRRALELNPQYANTHHFFSICLAATGRLEEALHQIREARKLDAFSPFIGLTTAGILFHSRHYDLALEELRRVLEVNPDLAMARLLTSATLIEQGMPEEAIRELADASDGPIRKAGLAYAYAASGRRSEALALVRQVSEDRRHLHAIAYPVALVYARLGDNSQAIEWLEKGYEERATLMVWINVDPRLASLQSEPRMKALLARMGFL